MRKNLLLLIILSLITLWPFFKRGYFESHDGEWMVIRFTAFHQTLASGQFPVRFVDRLNNNYGYPVLNFLYPLPFYLAEIPKIIGFGFVDSIKIIFILATVSSALAMYWALLSIFDKYSSLAGAILYLYAPYRFVDLYVRGSLGESLAFAFVPLVAGSIFKIANGYKLYFPILSLSTALLILSHNVIAVLFIPFFVTLSLFIVKNDRLKLLAYFILGILMSSFFTIPALLDLRYVKLSQIKVSEISHHLADINQILIPYWGYGPNPQGPNPLPVQMGIVPIFLALSALLIRLFKKTKNYLVDFQIVIFLIVAFMLTKYSLPLWKIIPFIDVIQFPWRLLCLITFIAAFLAAYLLSLIKSNQKLAILLIITSVLATIIYAKPQKFVERSDSYYSTNEDTTTVQDEYLPLWVSVKPQVRASQKITLDGPGSIESTIIKASNYQATIKTDEQTRVVVNTIYFPGWQAKIDGQSVLIEHQNKFGLISFQLPKGVHQIIINYARTTVHLLSEIISIFASAIAGFIFYRLWTKRNS